MKSFRDPKYVERYEDVIFDLETAVNTTVANNAYQKKDGYRFVVDNSGEVTPFDWYNARISLDFKAVLLNLVPRAFPLKMGGAGKGPGIGWSRVPSYTLKSWV